MPSYPFGQFISDYTSLGGYFVRNTKRAAVVPVSHVYLTYLRIDTVVLVDFDK